MTYYQEQPRLFLVDKMTISLYLKEAVMNNPVFEQYMLDQAEQAVNVFRTFNKEDFIDEFIDPDHSLIEEAFNDVETLLNYSNVIGKNNSISMEECGFIASHINSIEHKYKGNVDFNIVASESQGSDFRAALDIRYHWFYLYVEEKG